MRYKIFSISILDPDAGTEALNRFLASRKIVAVDKQLVQLDHGAWWTFAVGYIESSPGSSEASRPKTIDYREVLDTEAFSRFVQIHELRNHLAKQEGKPPITLNET